MKTESARRPRGLRLFGRDARPELQAAGGPIVESLERRVLFTGLFGEHTYPCAVYVIATRCSCQNGASGAGEPPAASGSLTRSSSGPEGDGSVEPCGAGVGVEPPKVVLEDGNGDGGLTISKYAGMSAEPVRDFDGYAVVNAVDLSSDAFGKLWGQGRSYSIPNISGPMGNHWIVSDLPFLYVQDGVIVAVATGTDTRFFIADGGGNLVGVGPMSPDTLTATNVGGVDYFVLGDSSGGQTTFCGLSSSTPGQFYSYTDAAGNVTSVQSRDSDGQVTEVQRSSGSTIESWLYNYGLVPDGSGHYYGTGGINQEVITSVQLRRKVGTGSWEVERQVVYGYYDGTTAGGSLGDLASAKVEDASCGVISETDYRYWKSGEYADAPANFGAGDVADPCTPQQVGEVKAVFDMAAVTRARAAGHDPTTASDADVDSYATNYYTYYEDELPGVDPGRDGEWHVYQETAAGTGSSADAGRATTTYLYNEYHGSLGCGSEGCGAGVYAQYTAKTEELLPRGGEEVTYSNQYGETLMKVSVDAAGNLTSGEYFQYDDDGRLTMHAEPSAVNLPATLEDLELNGDLVGYDGSTYQYLNAGKGLIETTEYYHSTTATGTTAGGVTGYVEDTAVQQGYGGARVIQEFKNYFTHSAGGATVSPVATDTVYGNTDGTDARTTGYTYTWDTGTSGVKTMTVSLAPITAAQNGGAPGGTTSSAGSTTTLVATGLTGATDAYVGNTLLLTSGTEAGSTAVVTGYNASTHTLTFTAATPDGTLPSAVASGVGFVMSTDNTQEVFDVYGNVTWTKDADGFINYYEYDPRGTGAVVKAITDVNTSDTGDFSGLPTGWTTPSGGGDELITTYDVDGLGRTTHSTSPGGSVSFVKYNDAGHEERVYTGRMSGTNFVEVGPIAVSRTYYPAASAPSGEDVVYFESLTSSATPTETGGVPDGSETLGSANIQTLSRTLTNASGQIVERDDYFSLAGVTYGRAAARLGTASNNSATGNYHATTFGYDSSGRLFEVKSPTGTITETVYDSLDRVSSVWVGTNDQPGTSGAYWTPTNHGTNSNMVKVADDYYDTYDPQTAAVGDGNLTRQVLYPSGTNGLRVTENYYDYRDRLVATKSGSLLDSSNRFTNPTGESDDAHRLVTYYTYDNLDEVTQTDRYAGDGVTFTNTNHAVVTTAGVPDAPAAANLRARTQTLYDDQGRAYRTGVFSVDPTNGTNVSSHPLDTNVFFNRRGQVMDVVQPGGAATKYAYDGAGRNVTVYTTDGGAANTSPGTLQSWANAGTVSADLVLQQVDTQYDGDGNAVLTTTRQRFHNDATNGTGAFGALQNPSTGPKARVYYTTNYYDAADRLIASADYGTNGTNGATAVNVTSIPTRSDQVLVTSYGYAADGLQTVDLSGSPTGGTFTLTFLGHTTSGIAYNATPATVQSDLEALTGVGSGQVSVVGVAGQYYTVRFTGTLGEQAVGQITVASSLTGGTSPTAALTSYLPGGDGGTVSKVTDPRGIVSKTDTDLLGRTVSTVGDFTTGSPTSSSDQLTAYTYDGDDHVVTQTAWNKSGASAATFQTTAYIYGATTAGGSALNSNDLLVKVEYPDHASGNASGSGSNSVSFAYFATGDQKTKTDQNNTTHAYGYDALGRLTSDNVTTLGGGVDSAVQGMTYSFNDAGLPYQNTSYIDPADASPNNQERFTYDGFGNLIKDNQAQITVVHTTGIWSRSVQYVYDYSDDTAGNHDRLVEMIYPNGRALHYGYDGNPLDDAVSRTDYLADDNGSGAASTTHIVDYSFLGLGTVVQESRPEEGVALTYVKQTGDTLAGSDGGDQYSGLDRFGRVADQNWINTSTGAAVDRTQYGYDRDGNVLYKNNLGPGSNAASFSSLYSYDNLNRVTSYERGTLNSGLNAITSPTASQTWSLDAQGNWGAADAQNELPTLTYDANGNTLTDGSGNTYTYDAWNRLVTLAKTGVSERYVYLPGRDQGFELDGGGGSTDTYFYSTSGQLLQETPNGTPYLTQYVWGLTYVNDLIARDRDADSNQSTGSLGSSGSGMEERTYVLRDANHDVTEITGQTGSMLERFSYAPYGDVTALNPNWTAYSGSDYKWVYLFQGGRKDPISGLYKFGLREYSGSLGLWMQHEPNGGQYVDGPNLYLAFHANPLAWNDGSGRAAEYGPSSLINEITNWAVDKGDAQFGKAPDGTDGLSELNERGAPKDIAESIVNDRLTTASKFAAKAKAANDTDTYDKMMAAKGKLRNMLKALESKDSMDKNGKLGGKGKAPTQQGPPSPPPNLLGKTTSCNAYVKGKWGEISIGEMLGDQVSDLLQPLGSGITGWLDGLHTPGGAGGYRGGVPGVNVLAPSGYGIPQGVGATSSVPLINPIEVLP